MLMLGKKNLERIVKSMKVASLHGNSSSTASSMIFDCYRKVYI